MLLHKYNYNFTDATYVIALLQYFGLVNKFLFRNSMCCHISAKKTIIDISASVTWRPPKILSRCLRWGGEDEVRTGRAHLGRARWGGEDRSGSPRRSEVRTGRAHLGGRASCGWSPGGGRPPRRWRGRAGRRRRCASRGTCLGSASSSCRTTSSWLAGSGSTVNARTTGQRMMDRWQQQHSQWEDNGWWTVVNRTTGDGQWSTGQREDNGWWTVVNRTTGGQRVMDSGQQDNGWWTVVNRTTGGQRVMDSGQQDNGRTTGDGQWSTGQREDNGWWTVVNRTMGGQRVMDSGQREDNGRTTGGQRVMDSGQREDNEKTTGDGQWSTGGQRVMDSGQREDNGRTTGDGQWSTGQREDNGWWTVVNRTMWGKRVMDSGQQDNGRTTGDGQWSTGQREDNGWWTVVNGRTMDDRQRSTGGLWMMDSGQREDNGRTTADEQARAATRSMGG